MSKISVIDRAIAQLQSEIEILQLAIQKLKSQQTKAQTRRPRVAEAKRATDAA